MANDAYDNRHADLWALKQAKRNMNECEQQRRNNDTGHPHPMNGFCQAERPNASNDFAGPCNAPLYAYRATATKPEGTYCGVLTCPAYDVPKPARAGVVLRFVEVA